MSVERAIRELSIQIEAAGQKALSRSNTKKILDEAAKIVRRRTLLGFGVEENEGPRKRLKKLSASYKEQRRRLGKPRKVSTGEKFRSKLRLSPKTTPAKSNLTLTGQLLDSIRARVTGPGKGFLTPTGQRNDGFSNEEIAAFVEEAGRDFMNLSNNEIKQLSDFAQDILQVDIEKLLTTIT